MEGLLESAGIGSKETCTYSWGGSLGKAGRRVRRDSWALHRHSQHRRGVERLALALGLKQDVDAAVVEDHEIDRLRAGRVGSG